MENLSRCQGSAQGINPGATAGTQQDALDITIHVPLDSRLPSGGIDLVPYQDTRHGACPDFLQDAIDDLDLRFALGRRRIYDVQQQVSAGRLFQRGVKCSDEAAWGRSRMKPTVSEIIRL